MNGKCYKIGCGSTVYLEMWFIGHIISHNYGNFKKSIKINHMFTLWCNIVIMAVEDKIEVNII